MPLGPAGRDRAERPREAPSPIVMNMNGSHGGGGGGTVKHMTSLYTRQPSQTQIPIPKKFTASLKMGLDTGSKSPVLARSTGSSSVAARAQLFQSGSGSSNNNNNNGGSVTNNNNNIANGGGFHARNGSTTSSNGSYSRNGSASSSGSSSPTKTVGASPFNGKVVSNGGSSVAFSNGAPPSPARAALGSYSNGVSSPASSFGRSATTNGGTAYGGSSVAFNNGAPPAASPVLGPGAPLSPGASPADKWRAKYEESERKRKLLLTSSEKNAREASELQRKLQQLQREHDATKRDLKDREDKLTQLRTVSERVYKEYDQLKNRYEVETGAMHQAMQRASESELNSARLQEFEAQEAAVTASAELDESRRAQNELAELRALKENMAAAASLVQKEVAVLRQQCEQERKTARRMKSEADHAVKERNVMAHQSSLLAEALSQDDRLLPILAEVENLKRLLEEERCRTRELQAGPRGLDDGEEADERNDVVELLDERLKIAEEELRSAANRADRAERENSELRERLSLFEKELEDRRTAAPPPPPPPPMAPPMPPPPPPPPLPTLSPGGGGGGVGSVKLRSRVASGGSGGSGGSSATGSSEDLVNAERNAVQDMANLLGIPRKPQMPEAIPGGAIDNIINQIKGGRFTLKATEQNLQKEKKEEPPPAVTEMLNILGTLRRRPRASAKPTEVSEAPRDVAL
ncbi:hypothetical protein FOCC_FOCC013899 [Frankliniella occidentalis]|nr:hypothetical protein FOCC_FOCC013899 [Frankliniella occidentalis]